jgi:hypothetical protein
MRPEKGTYPQYYTHYLPLVKEDNVIDALVANEGQVQSFFKSVPKAKEEHSYAPGKWTVKQIMQHLCDTERILSYRALRFARMDAQQPLPFDENKYVANVMLLNRTLADILSEFETVRRATLSLYRTFDDDTLQHIGKTAAGEASVLALGYMICGHAIHHMNVVNERYL